MGLVSGKQTVEIQMISNGYLITGRDYQHWQAGNLEDALELVKNAFTQPPQTPNEKTA